MDTKKQGPWFLAFFVDHNRPLPKHKTHLPDDIIILLDDKQAKLDHISILLENKHLLLDDFSVLLKYIGVLLKDEEALLQ